MGIGLKIFYWSFIQIKTDIQQWTLISSPGTSPTLSHGKINMPSTDPMVIPTLRPSAVPKRNTSSVPTLDLYYYLPSVSLNSLHPTKVISQHAMDRWSTIEDSLFWFTPHLQYVTPTPLFTHTHIMLDSTVSWLLNELNWIHKEYYFPPNNEPSSKYFSEKYF